MAAPTYTLPTVGNPNSTEDPLIRTALSDLKTLLTDGIDDGNIATGGIAAGSLASDSVTTVKILDDNVTAAKVADGAIDAAAKLSSDVVTTAKILNANVTDAKLASPNNSVYRTLLASKGYFHMDVGAATYMLGSHQLLGDIDSQGMCASTGPINTNPLASDTHIAPDMIYFDDADFTAGSLTQKLRLRAQVSANATQPLITFTFGLYPVTVAGTANLITYTLGTVVASSTVASASPAASTITSVVNTDFTVPSDGAYMIGVATSGTLTNNSAVAVHAQLQHRSV